MNGAVIFHHQFYCIPIRTRFLFSRLNSFLHLFFFVGSIFPIFGVFLFLCLCETHFYRLIPFIFFYYFGLVVAVYFRFTTSNMWWRVSAARFFCVFCEVARIFYFCFSPESERLDVFSCAATLQQCPFNYFF